MIEVVPGEVGTHRVRLAISPIEEVLHALRVLNRPGRSPVHARWAVAHRPTLADLEDG